MKSTGTEKAATTPEEEALLAPYIGEIEALTRWVDSLTRQNRILTTALQQLTMHTQRGFVADSGITVRKHAASALSRASEREWIKTAPLNDVVMGAILRGVEGYPDDDTERAAYVLARLHEIGAIKGDIHMTDGITCGELRRRAQHLFGMVEDDG